MTPLERTREIQVMLFQTAPGGMLLSLFMEAGHFYGEIENESARIEHDLMKRILQVCGVQLRPEPRPLPTHEELPKDGLDDILQSQPE